MVFQSTKFFLFQQSTSLLHICTFYQTKGLLIKFNVYVSKRFKQFLQLLQHLQTYKKRLTQICLCSNKSLKWWNRATWISYTCHLKRFFPMVLILMAHFMIQLYSLYFLLYMKVSIVYCHVHLQHLQIIHLFNHFYINIIHDIFNLCINEPFIF